MKTAKEITKLRLTEAWLEIAQLQWRLARESAELAHAYEVDEVEADAEVEKAKAVVDDVLVAKVKHDVRHGR